MYNTFHQQIVKMARLSERTVQEIAQKYLEKYYKRRAKGGKMFSKIEVRTKKQFGGYRADGFLAFRRWFRGIYVISMESKSFKTQKAIEPYRSDKLWRNNSLWVGFLIAVASGSFFAIVGFENPVLGLMFFGAVYAIGGLGYMFLSRNSYKHKMMPVLEQVEQYPANEKWISISEDSFNDISGKGQGAFLKICKSRGYGLIIVDKKKKPRRFYRPKKINKFWGDYLTFYSLENDIRKYLG